MRAWESNIRKVVPYTPGEQPKGDRLIKLNTNENPYPPAPGVAEALKHMDIDRFRKYPDPTASDLVHALAEYYGVGEDQVFVGVGSDDVIAMSFLTFFNSEKPVLFPDVSYSFYKVWADLFAIPYETPALDANFCIHPEDYYRENGGVIFPNPNAPTGLLLSLEAVEDMIRHNQDVVVIVDEAYIDFGGKSALELIKRGHRLVSDDVVEIRRVSDETIIGSAPDITRHFIELRGIGIIDVKTLFGVESVKDTQSVDLVIKLEEWDRDKEYDRLGLHEEYTEYLGNKIVCHSLPIRPGRNLAIIVESAAVNHRQKKMGYNAAEELYKRVQANLAKKREER